MYKSLYQYNINMMSSALFVGVVLVAGCFLFEFLVSVSGMFGVSLSVNPQKGSEGVDI